MKWNRKIKKAAKKDVKMMKLGLLSGIHRLNKDGYLNIDKIQKDIKGDDIRELLYNLIEKYGKY